MMGCDGNGYVLSIFFPDHNVEILFKQFGKNHIQSGKMDLPFLDAIPGFIHDGFKSGFFFFLGKPGF
jgi:hypothetical protein